MSRVLETIGSSELNRMFLNYYGRTKSQKRAFVHLAYELDRMGKAEHSFEEKLDALVEQQSELLDEIRNAMSRISALEKSAGSVVQPKRKPGRPRKEASSGTSNR